MNEKQDNFPQLPNGSWGEAVLESGKAFFDIFGGYLPIAGPTVALILGREIKKRNENRLKEYLERLEEYIKLIPDDIINSDKFKDAIFYAISKYMSAPSEKERIFISHLNLMLLKSIPNTKDINRLYNMFFIFSELFSKLSLPTLDCLIAFRQKFPQDKKKPTRYEIIELFRTLSPLYADHAFLELMNNALIEEEGMAVQPSSINFQVNVTREEIPLGSRKYKLQPLGALFSDWLEAKCKVSKEE